MPATRCAGGGYNRGMHKSPFLVMVSLISVCLSACAHQAPRTPEAPAAPTSPAATTTYIPPLQQPSPTSLFLATSQPTLDWPQQPVLLATHSDSNPLVVWLPNGELLFWSQLDGKQGAYWLSPQGRAVYLDFADTGPPLKGAANGYATAFERFSPIRMVVRLTGPTGFVRSTYDVVIDRDWGLFPERPEAVAPDEGSLRETARYAGQALESFACSAAWGANGEVRLTFDWACASQSARLWKAEDASQWPIMLEPLSSSLALVCPGSAQGDEPIPLGTCIEQMADWADRLVAAARQDQQLAQRHAAATALVLALTPGVAEDEALDLLEMAALAEPQPGLKGAPEPTATLGPPAHLDASRSAVTGTPTLVPTGVGVCGWYQALPGIWEWEGAARKGDLVELKLFTNGNFRAKLQDWPESLRGNYACQPDGRLKLNFRQGYLFASVNLAEDKLSFDVLSALGLPAYSQSETWHFKRKVE
jgi:hypothetical protein